MLLFLLELSSLLNLVVDYSIKCSVFKLKLSPDVLFLAPSEVFFSIKIVSYLDLFLVILNIYRLTLIMLLSLMIDNLLFLWLFIF